MSWRAGNAADSCSSSFHGASDAGRRVPAVGILKRKFCGGDAVKASSTPARVVGESTIGSQGPSVALVLPRHVLPQALLAVRTPSPIAVFSTLDEAKHWARERPTGVFLVDPAILVSEYGDHWLRNHTYGWLTIVYCAADCADATALLECAARWPLPVMVGRRDETAFPVELCVEESDGVCQSAELLTILAPRLRSLPSRFLVHLVETFAAYQPPSSLKALAAVAGVSERHARRLLRSAGVHSSHRLFVSIRVARAYRDMVQRRLSLAETVRRRGFGTRRTLRREWEEATGMIPNFATRAALDDGFAESLVGRLLAARETITAAMSANGPPMSAYDTSRGEPLISM
jgi:AraC-like DNA-binding protein